MGIYFCKCERKSEVFGECCYCADDISYWKICENFNKIFNNIFTRIRIPPHDTNMCNIHSRFIHSPYGFQFRFRSLHICVHVWQASHHRNFIAYIYFIKLNIKCGKMNEYYLIWISIDFKLRIKASFFLSSIFSSSYFTSAQSTEQDSS